jgi:hypothetical protein
MRYWLGCSELRPIVWSEGICAGSCCARRELSFLVPVGLDYQFKVLVFFSFFVKSCEGYECCCLRGPRY